MTAPAVLHPAPHRESVRPWVLLYGTCGAPLLWFIQELLGYGVSSLSCYGSDHPTPIAWTGTLRAILIAFDAVAIAGAIIGFIVSYTAWRAVREEKEGDHHIAMDIGDGRTRFLALWGMLSSLGFFFAIVFATIAAGLAPLCPR